MNHAYWVAGLVLGIGLSAGPTLAQRSVTLSEAIAAAQANAPSVALAVADSAMAHAEVSLARAVLNPTLALGYSASPPNNHIDLEQPLFFPWTRSALIIAAERGADAARLLVEAERMTVRFRVEIAYVQLAGATEIARLSRQNVQNGLELLNSVRAREAAGDASELDVALTEVVLGQLRSTLLTDSLAAMTASVELGTLMSLSPTPEVIIPADSLGAIAASFTTPSASAGLRLRAAEMRVASSAAALKAARYSRLPVPSIHLGAEWGEPDSNKLYPIIGLALPIPIWTRGSGEIEVARTKETHSAAELAALEHETQLALARAERARAIAAERLVVDRATLQAAQRVATLSLIAYREGAYPLSSILEAQRASRDALRQYLEDLIRSRTAEAALLLARAVGGATP